MGKKRVAQKAADSEILEPQKGSDFPRTTSRKKLHQVQRALIYIKSSYNNLMLTVADNNGDVLTWATSGQAGFKGPKKSTPFAASRVVDLAFSSLGNMEINEAEVYVRGVGGGRDAALRTMLSKGLNIVSIKDITPIAHGGVRPSKRRRV